MPYPGFVAAVLGITVAAFLYLMLSERRAQQQQQQYHEQQYWHGDRNPEDYSHRNGWCEESNYERRRARQRTKKSFNSEICTICLNTTNEEFTSMEPCGHVFHQGCITQWRNIGAEGSTSCPNCRHRFTNRI